MDYTRTFLLNINKLACVKSEMRGGGGAAHLFFTFARKDLACFGLIWTSWVLINEWVGNGFHYGYICIKLKLKVRDKSLKTYAYVLFFTKPIYYKE